MQALMIRGTPQEAECAREESKSKEQMTFIQINRNFSKVTQHLLGQSVLKLNVDTAIISEPLKRKGNAIWATDQSVKHGIWTTERYPLEKIA